MGLAFRFALPPRLIMLPLFSLPSLRPLLCRVPYAAFAVQVWLLDPPAASAQLLAQSGMTKSLLGYGLAILALILGLAVVCRPADRNKVVKTRIKRGEG